MHILLVKDLIWLSTLATLASKTNSDPFHVVPIHCGRTTYLAPVLKTDSKGKFFISLLKFCVLLSPFAILGLE